MKKKHADIQHDIHCICFLSPNFVKLFKGYEPGWVGGANTGPTVLDGLIRDWEFAQIVADHIGFDFNLIEGLQ